MRDNFLWVWLLLLLGGVFLGTAVVRQTVVRLDYQPIVTDALTSFPIEPTSKAVDSLSEHTTIIQRFIAPVSYISDITIGVRNFRKAPSDALLVVDLVNAQDTIISSVTVQVGSFGSNDLTSVPLSSVLHVGDSYSILLHTMGIVKEHAVTVSYEPSVESYPKGSLHIRNDITGKIRDIDGNIRFQLLRRPTLRAVLVTLLHSPGAYASFAFCIAICLLWLRPLRSRLSKLLEEQPREEAPVSYSWQEIGIVLILGLALAVAITIPFYKNVHSLDTMGDVQRTLLYLGLGQKTLVSTGEVALWNPYSCGGIPLVADSESNILDPGFFLFVLPFGEQLGVRLLVTMTLFFGFTGSYFLARRFMRIPPLPSLIAGILFTLSGFQMLAFSTGVFAWIPIGLIPWFLYTLLSSLKKPRLLVVSSMIMAAMILGGNPHMPLFASITAFFLMLFWSIFNRSWKPLLFLCIVLISAGTMSAVKLVPAIEFLALFDNFHREPAFIPPLSWIPKMFLDRGQLTTPLFIDHATGIPYRWPEFASYIGLLPVLMFFAGIPLMLKNRNTWPWILTSVLLFLMIFGQFPWALFHEMPVLSELVRSSSRIRSVFFLVFGMLVAWSVSELSRRFFKKALLRNAFVIIVTLFIFIDLFTLYAPLFKDLFNQPLPSVSQNNQFRRISHGYTNDQSEYWHASYVSYLNNEGTNDLCNPTMMTTHSTFTAAVDDLDPQRPYQGEGYLAQTKDGVTDIAITPNKITATFTSPKQDTLVLNQNYFPGWRTVPAREVYNYKGLLAARIGPNDSRLTFVYSPFSYHAGKYITILALLLALVVIIKPFLRRTV